jgi:hypothetical protein
MAVIPEFSATHNGNRSIMNTIMLLFLIPLKAPPYLRKKARILDQQNTAEIPAAYEKFTGRAYQ